MTFMKNLQRLATEEVAGKSSATATILAACTAITLLIHGVAVAAPSDLYSGTNSDGLQMVNFVLGDELGTWLEGGSTTLAFPQEPKPDAVVEARRFGEQFGRNEVAAMRSVQNKRVRLTGKVLRVRIAAGSQDPVAEIEAPGMTRTIFSIQARMTADSADAAAAYQPGQTVSLLCDGAERSALAVSFYRCRDAAAVQKALLDSLGREVRDFLRNGSPISFTAANGNPEGGRITAILVYAVGSIAGPDWLCIMPNAARDRCRRSAPARKVATDAVLADPALQAFARARNTTIPPLR